MLILLLCIHCTGFAQCGVSFSYSNSVWCACTGMVTAMATGTAPFQFQWSTGATTNYIDSLCAGTYTVTITDSTGCSAVDSVSITQPPPMTFTITSTAVSCTSCNDACITTTATDGCPPYSFVYTPFNPQPCMGIYDTTYTVTITDACNCTLTGSITPDTIPVGINDNRNLENIISVKPNPVSDYLTVEITTLPFGKNYLSIYNMLGDVVLKENFSSQKYLANVSGLAKGVYTIEVRSQINIWRKKFIME